MPNYLTSLSFWQPMITTRTHLPPTQAEEGIVDAKTTVDHDQERSTSLDNLTSSKETPYSSWVYCHSPSPSSLIHLSIVYHDEEQQTLPASRSSDSEHGYHPTPTSNLLISTRHGP